MSYLLLGNLGPDLMSKDIVGDLSPNVLLLWVVISSSLFLSLSPLTCRYRCSVSYQTPLPPFLSFTYRNRCSVSYQTPLPPLFTFTCGFRCPVSCQTLPFYHLKVRCYVSYQPPPPHTHTHTHTHLQVQAFSQLPKLLHPFSFTCRYRY